MKETYQRNGLVYRESSSEDEGGGGKLSSEVIEIDDDDDDDDVIAVGCCKLHVCITATLYIHFVKVISKHLLFFPQCSSGASQEDWTCQQRRSGEHSSLSDCCLFLMPCHV